MTWQWHRMAVGQRQGCAKVMKEEREEGEEGEEGEERSDEC